MIKIEKSNASSSSSNRGTTMAKFSRPSNIPSCYIVPITLCSPDMLDRWIIIPYRCRQQGQQHNTADAILQVQRETTTTMMMQLCIFSLPNGESE